MGKPRPLLASFTAIALLIAGCGSSSSGDSTDSTGSGSSVSTNSAKAGGTPIKVGVICSCTGPFGTNIDAAGKVSEAWSKSVNAAGGINGHPIKLMKYDDAGNPGTSVTKAQSLISAHADVILDLTPLDAAWSKIVSDAHIPVVGGELTSAAFTEDPDFYPSGQTSDALPESIVAVAKIAGATNIGELYCAEAPSCQETVPKIKAEGTKLRVPVVYSASISATAPNYTAQCVAAKQAHVTGLYVSHSSAVVANVARDCSRQGYNPVILEAGTGFSMKLASTPGTKDRLWISFPILPFFVDKPEVRKMNEALDKYYPGERTNVDAWSTFASQAWTGALLIERAVEASGVNSSGALSSAAIKKGLDSLKNETLGGWSPPLTFTAGKPHSVGCWYTARIQNGKPALANGGKISCQNKSQ